MNGEKIAQMIEDGELRQGDELWVACLYHNNIKVNKPARHVEPVFVTLVTDSPFMVRFETVNQPHKTITLTSSTGLPGGMLHGFATEAECRAAYQTMCDEFEVQVLEEKARLDDLLSKVQKFWTKNA